MTIVLIIGLPASGKTSFAQECIQSDYLNGFKSRLIDDARANTDIDIQDDDDIVFITSPWFCRIDILRGVRDFLFDNWSDFAIMNVYFENDAAQCLVNAQKRPEKKVDNLIRLLSNTYFPPENALPVWSEL